MRQTEEELNLIKNLIIKCVFLIAIGHGQVASSWNLGINKNPCAELFESTRENNNSTLQLHQGEQFVDLGDIYLIGNNLVSLSNASLSASVKRNCAVLMCSGSYFKATCVTISNNSSSHLQETDIDLKISSACCKCEMVNSTYNINDEIPISIEYPPTIEIPDTPEHFLSTNWQAQQNNNDPNHAGTLAGQESFKNGRSHRNAYMLVLGMTGAGKSSSINFLFGNSSIAAVGENESVTSEIREYISPLAVRELGINNSELHIIDTPGLGDTRGLQHDAQFLATLELYLTNHTELRHRIPNVVLVFAKFTENRISGDGANFVKMLRGLDLLSKKLFSKSFSNVIIVLTHFMSESVDLRRNPAPKLAEFKKAIEDHSLFPKPIIIVVAENYPEDEDLPLRDGHYQLPSGDLYPRNIFEKLDQLTRNGGDPIGYNVMRAAFEHPNILKISKNITPLLNSSNPLVNRYLEILTTGNFKIEETEVSKILADTYYNDTVFPANLRSKYPDTLPYLQLVLNVRNIFTKKDLPRKDFQIARLLKDIRRSPATITLLEKSLGLKAPIFEDSHYILTGKSYDVLTDRVLDSSPFTLGSGQISQNGYVIQNEFDLKIQNEFQNNNFIFNSKQEYYKKRLETATLGQIQVQDIDYSKFSGEIPVGYNIWGGDSNFKISISTSHEKRSFRLSLKDNASIPLTPALFKSVNALPKFDINNETSIHNYQAFFNTYGTHVVKSVHGGGSIEIILTMQYGNKIWRENDKRTKVNLMAQFAQDLSNGEILNAQTAELKMTKFVNSTFMIIFKCGNNSISRTLNSFHQTEFQERLRIIETWNECTSAHPKMLRNSILLMPISDIVKSVSEVAAIQVALATKALLSTGLVYSPNPDVLKEFAEAEVADAELVKAETELKIIAEEKKLELERLQLKIEAEKARQMEILEAERKKMVEENAKRAEEIAREFKRAEEERRKELERIAEANRLEAIRLETERQRVEMEQAEKQKLELLRIQREMEAEKQRQLAAELVLEQKKLEAQQEAMLVSLHRYWNGKDHFYTTNWNELGGGRSGYNYEGVAGKIFSTQVPGTLPFHRYYNNKNGDHHYTTNWNELHGGRWRYVYEGIQGYIYPSSMSGTIPFHRYYNGRSGDHFFTTSWAELGGGRSGYGYEGVAGYIRAA